MRLRSTPPTELPAGILGASFERPNCRPLRRPASHPYVVLALQSAGRVTVEQGGVFEVGPGDLHVMPAGALHRVFGTEAGGEAQASRAEIAAFCTSCLDRERLAPVLAPLDRVRRGASPVFRVPEERRAHLQSLFGELRRESSLAAPSHLALESLLALIFVEVDRASRESHGEGALVLPAALAPGLASEALAFIESNALGALSLSDVAGHLRRSPGHVAESVKKATGRSVGEWILGARLAEARRRLAETDELVEVIAERVGFVSAAHFARVFRKAEGVSATAYRKARGRRTS